MSKTPRNERLIANARQVAMTAMRREMAAQTIHEAGKWKSQRERAQAKVRTLMNPKEYRYNIWGHKKRPKPKLAEATPGPRKIIPVKKKGWMGRLWKRIKALFR